MTKQWRRRRNASWKKTTKSTNTGPRSAARFEMVMQYMNLKHLYKTFIAQTISMPLQLGRQSDGLCSRRSKAQISGQPKFFSFHLNEEMNQNQTRIRTIRTATDQEIPCSLADGRRQKLSKSMRLYQMLTHMQSAVLIPDEKCLFLFK